MNDCSTFLDWTWSRFDHWQIYEPSVSTYLRPGSSDGISLYLRLALNGYQGSYLHLRFASVATSEAVDIWSTGCILGEMLTRRLELGGKDMANKLLLDGWTWRVTKCKTLNQAIQNDTILDLYGTTGFLFLWGPVVQVAAGRFSRAKTPWTRWSTELGFQKDAT